MSGHSKWSTIKRQKGVADIKRGQTFTKITNVITIAVKLGGSGDPNSNPRLRMAIDTARSVNMPNANVQRAIDRGLGKLGGEILEEVIYEGFGPGRVAFIVEGITDNKLRTNQEIRSIFERNGGHLTGLGAVSYMFEKKGELRVKGKVGNKDEEMLALIDLGAEDVEDYLEDNQQKYLVYIESSELNTIGVKITQSGFEIESRELILKPITIQKISDKELANKIISFAEKLEEQDDVQKVYSNIKIPESIYT